MAPSARSRSARGWPGGGPGARRTGGPRVVQGGCRAGGGPAATGGVWLATVVDPSEAGVEQLRRGLVAYLSAPGYGEMFAEAGFGELVRFARTGPHPGELLAAIPAELTGH